MIRVRVFGILFAFAQPLAKGFDTPAEFAGDLADATWTEKQDDDHKDDDPFSAAW